MSEPRIQQNYSVPQTGGSTLAFNSIPSSPIKILSADAAHDDFILCNPGSAPVLVYQALDTAGGSLAPTFASPGGGVILGSGESAEVTGEAAQGEWRALAQVGDSASLTIYLRSAIDRAASSANSTATIFQSYTAAQIADATNAVNTTGKAPGLTIRDSTNHRLMVADGSAPTSAWYVCDGSTFVTPA